MAHRLETLFARLRDGELAATPALFDLAYQTLDALGVLVVTPPKDGTGGVDVPALCARLEAGGATPDAPAPTRAAAGGRSLAQRLQKPPGQPSRAAAGRGRTLA